MPSQSKVGHAEKVINQKSKKENRERIKLRKILKKSSFLCREESLKVCREFEALPNPIPRLD